MPKYKVQFNGKMIIAGKDLDDANEKFKDHYPEFSADRFINQDTGEAHEVDCQCEVSGLSIFQNDEVYMDDEGVTWLKRVDERIENTD
jgi:regulator of RNase E activity RraA